MTLTFNAMPAMPSHNGSQAPTSLAASLSKWFFATSFALVLIASAVLYWATLSALRFTDDQVLEGWRQQISYLLSVADPGDGVIEHEIQEHSSRPRAVFMRIIDADGRVAHETEQMSRLLPVSAMPSALTEHPVYSTITSPQGETFRVVTSRTVYGPQANRKAATLQIATDTSLDGPALASYRRLLYGIVIAALAACSIAALNIVRRSLAPLRQLTGEIALIDSESIDRRIDVAGNPKEIFALGGAFNQMLGRLGSAYHGLQHFADNVAHELRSPLNKMLVSTEVALSRPRNVEEYQDLLKLQLESCQRMTRIVNAVLFLSRAENTRMEFERDVIDPKTELAQLAEYFASSAAEAGISLSVTAPENAAFQANRDFFRQAVSNLVSNSIANTLPGGRISITAARDFMGMTTITVEDTGRGIADDVQPFVFERFYSTDTVRSATDGHLGLGLPIAKCIVELHGGTISLSSEVGRGTRVTMTFPSG